MILIQQRYQFAPFGRQLQVSGVDQVTEATCDSDACAYQLKQHALSSQQADVITCRSSFTLTHLTLSGALDWQATSHCML